MGRMRRAGIHGIGPKNKRSHGRIAPGIGRRADRGDGIVATFVAMARLSRQAVQTKGICFQIFTRDGPRYPNPPCPDRARSLFSTTCEERPCIGLIESCRALLGSGALAATKSSTFSDTSVRLTTSGPLTNPFLAEGCAGFCPAAI